MKILTLVILLFSMASQADVLKTYESLLQSGKVDALEKLEKEIDKEFKNILKDEKKNEIQMDIVKTYFPYKLPMKYKGRNLYLNCYPSFDHFMNFTTQENFNNWKDCLSLDFGNKLPKFHQKALKAFNKHSY